MVSRASSKNLIVLLLCAAAVFSCRGKGNDSAAEKSQAVKTGSGRPAGAQAAGGDLRFGVTPYLDRDTMGEKFAPLVRYLSGRLGRKVDLFIAKDYSDLGEQVSSGAVQLGELSPLAYVVAKRKHPELRLLAMQITDGGLNYNGYIVARSESPAQKLSDLKGGSICFVDPNSASGYLYPRAMLIEEGFDPDAFFKSVKFSGDHLSCLNDVLDGKVNAGATYSGALNLARERGMKAGDLRIVAKTGRIPLDAYCASPALAEKTAAEMKAALLGLNTLTEDGRKVLTGFLGINGFVEATDDLYNPIREVEKILETKKTEAEKKSPGGH